MHNIYSRNWVLHSITVTTRGEFLAQLKYKSSTRQVVYHNSYRSTPKSWWVIAQLGYVQNAWDACESQPDRQHTLVWEYSDLFDGPRKLKGC